VDRLAADLSVDVVARIPFDPALARAGDAGELFLEGPGADSPAGRALVELAQCVAAWEPPEPEGDSC
jgi:hypothetical protein